MRAAAMDDEERSTVAGPAPLLCASAGSLRRVDGTRLSIGLHERSGAPWTEPSRQVCAYQARRTFL